MTCAFEPTKGNVVACGGLDNACSVYQLKNEPVHSGIPDVELHGHDGYVSCCRFLGPERIVSSSGDGSCIVWDVAKKRPERRLCEHQSDVMSIGTCCHDTVAPWQRGGCMRTRVD
jgi:guanine nucleotide-binding protein G(I)/G(S)/G(T) subunit beta-1